MLNRQLRPAGPRVGTTRHGARKRRRAIGALMAGAIAAAGVVMPSQPAESATITAEWDIGYDAPIIINGYGIDGAGSFVLQDGADTYRALCLEAQTAHSTVNNAYVAVPNSVTSVRLDLIAFMLNPRSGVSLTDDLATGLQFLAWYHSGAIRRGTGLPVWANSANGFSPVTPTAPDPWNALPAYSASFPVGIADTGTLTDLDHIEQIVWAQHNVVEANVGPWTMDAINYNPAVGTASTTVRAATGNGVSMIKNWRWIVTDSGGTEVQNVVATNNASGVVTLSGIPSLPSGGSIRLQGWSPGVHREYDGGAGNDIQRLMVGTPLELARDLPVAPSEQYVRIIKTSTDATISVAGTVLALLDGSGDEIDRVTVDGTGIGNFVGFDPTVYEPPYSIREITAAPGLEPLTSDVALPAGAYPISTDPNNPTEVTISNSARQEQLRVEKRTTGAAGAPSDLSGFQFQVTRSDGTVFGIVTTDQTGLSQVLFVTAGDYTVTEVARPAWWPASDPLPTPVSVTVPPNGNAVVSVEYTNVLPAPTIGTSATDQADDDRHLPLAGGTVVDVVSYDGVVAGTEYTVSGELMVLNDDGTTAATGIVGSTTFTPASSAGTVNVEFVVPAGSPFAGGATGVVFETLSVTATGTVVATHDDPTDAAQTVYFPTIGTSATDQADADKTLDPAAGGRIVDVVTYDDLQPGTEYTVSGELQLLNDDGTTTATGIVGSTTFSPATSSGTVNVEFVVPAGSPFADGGVGVVFETLAVTATGNIVASHEDPTDVEQTVYFPTIGTSATDQVDGDKFLDPTVGGTVVDVVSYTGLDPAVEYMVSGRMMVVSPTGTVSGAGVLGETTFTPATSSGTVEVMFTVPASGAFASGGVGVVFETLAVTATGNIVASHEDPTDVAQTVYFPSIGTVLAVPASDARGEAAKFTGADTPLVDVVSYVGLPSGEYRAELEMWERDSAGVCTATGISWSSEVTLTDPSGTFDVGPFILGRVGGTFVAYEQLYRLETQLDGTVTSTLVAAHTDCDDADQTVYAIGIESTVARLAPVGPGEQIDELVISGLVDGLPTGATAVVEIGLYQHPTSTPIGARTCTSANLAAIAEVDVTGDGTYRSPGEKFAVGSWSYNNQVVITFADGTEHRSDYHGCNVASETFVAAPSRNTPTRRVANTGSDLTMPMTTSAGALLVVGLGLLLATRRRNRAPAGPIG